MSVKNGVKTIIYKSKSYYCINSNEIETFYLLDNYIIVNPDNTFLKLNNYLYSNNTFFKPNGEVIILDKNNIYNNTFGYKMIYISEFLYKQRLEHSKVWWIKGLRLFFVNKNSLPDVVVNFIKNEFQKINIKNLTKSSRIKYKDEMYHIVKCKTILNNNLVLLDFKRETIVNDEFEEYFKIDIDNKLIPIKKDVYNRLKKIDSLINT